MKPWNAGQIWKSLLVWALACGGGWHSLAGTITGSFSPIATGSNVDLSIAGKTDWVHWGLVTESSLNRKWGVTPLISDYTVLGTGSVFVYQYSDNNNGYTWHDSGRTINM